ncbi:MAG: ABC transporter ATP-binding protein [Ilumatobacter sp.]
MNSSNTPPAIEFRSLRKSFGRTEVLRGVTTEVPVNSVFGFLGPNGAGKSTTMKILMGLLRPTSGTARVLGLDVESESLEVRRRVGYLPQSPAYPSHLTVAGVLELAARLRRVADRTGALLELVGLTDRAERRVRGLSGGEAQRLGLAQALVGDPDVLILDEPSAGLDPAGRHEVLGLLDELRTRATIFYSTHLLDDVARLSDTIAVLVRGEIVADGPIDQFTVGDSSSTWRVCLDGTNTAGAFETLARQPWVASVQTAGSGVATVATTDRNTAEHALLPVLHGAGARVVELRPTRRSLEDIYFALTDGTTGTGGAHEGRGDD